MCGERTRSDLQAIASRGSSVWRESERGAQRTLNPTPTGGADAWRMYATHRALGGSCCATGPGTSRSLRLVGVVTGPAVLRLEAMGNAPVALRSRSRECRCRLRP